MKNSNRKYIHKFLREKKVEVIQNVADQELHYGLVAHNCFNRKIQ